MKISAPCSICGRPRSKHYFTICDWSHYEESKVEPDFPYTYAPLIRNPRDDRMALAVLCNECASNIVAECASNFPAEVAEGLVPDLGGSPRVVKAIKAWVKWWKGEVPSRQLTG